jgi:hypothetical protein
VSCYIVLVPDRMSGEEMALTQNRLLLLCEAIPDFINETFVSASNNNKFDCLPSSATRFPAKAAAVSENLVQPKTSPNNKGPRKVNTVSGLAVTHAQHTPKPVVFSPNVVSLSSNSTSDRDISPPMVPSLLLSPRLDNYGSGGEGAVLTSARAPSSLTGKRKGNHADKVIPIKLSRKAGAGFIIFSITSHFNAGDTEKLEETLLAHCTDDCLFHVKSLSNPVVGNSHIITFLSSLLEALPDTYIVTANENVLDEYTLKVSIKFRGTRLHQSQLSAQFMKESLVENMNLSKMSESEVAALRTQETTLIGAMSPIELVFQGTVTVGFTEKIFDSRRKAMVDFSRVPGKINSFVLDYELKSFKDASVTEISAAAV